MALRWTAAEAARFGLVGSILARPAAVCCEAPSLGLERRATVRYSVERRPDAYHVTDWGVPWTIEETWIKCLHCGKVVRRAGV